MQYLLSIINLYMFWADLLLIIRRYYSVQKSTDLASYTLTQEILTALNNKIKVGGIFCDLHKAFDCVNHNILLAKMEFYGIVGRANTLIKSYLENRYQRVQIKKDTNKLLLWMGTGVRQGSTGINILSPLFLAIHKWFTKCNIGFIYTNSICWRH